MKNWDVSLLQIVLLMVGGYFVYQALNNMGMLTDSLQVNPLSFMYLMIEGGLLIGIAVALQQIRIYRARKTLQHRIQI